MDCKYTCEHLDDIAKLAPKGLELSNLYKNESDISVSRKNVNGLDLFAAVGGLSLAAEANGINVLAAIELEELQSEVYAKNNPHTAVLSKDVTKVDLDVLKSRIGNIDIIFGGVPCEPFSTVRSANEAKATDPRRNLISMAIKYVDKFKPKYVLFENVPEVANHDLWRRALGKLKRLGYDADIRKHSHHLVGGATIRKRSFLVGILNGKLPATDTIKTATPTTAGQAFASLGKPSPDHKDPYHRNLQTKPDRGAAENARARLAGKKPQYYGSRGIPVLRDKPTGTVIASANALIHWENRWLTAREIIKLQDFPSNYDFLESSANWVRTLLGDVVPIKLGTAVIGHLIGKRVSKGARKTLRVPDPRYIMDRLSGKGKAGVLVRSAQSDAVGQEFVLVNEKTQDETNVYAYGAVRMEAGIAFVNGDKAVRTLRDRIDNITAREFQSVQAQVWWHPLRLVEQYDEPREVKQSRRNDDGDTERARSTPGHSATEPVVKGIWGSPAGKTYLAKRIVAEIPDHRIYVEPFAGGARVLFKKEPSEVEVVSDFDPEIAFAFKFAKNATPAQLDRLRGMKWVGDKDHFRKLQKSNPPSDDVERFYRFAYLVRFSFNKLRRGTMPDMNVGVDARFVDKLERLAPRLEKVRVRCGDYEKVIDEYDGPDTFFFLDPPYAGYDAGIGVGVGHKDWDEARFAKVLRKIQGRFFCTYGIRGDAELFKDFHTRRWRHASGVGGGQGQGLRTGTTLVVTNYDPAKARRFQVDKAAPAQSDPHVGALRHVTPEVLSRTARQLSLDALLRLMESLEAEFSDGGDVSELKPLAEAISAEIKRRGEQVPSGALMRASDGDETQKAQWSTEYINDLADSAFLYVEDGGEKDEDGKTVPRSLRHFPYRNHRGDVDLPHIRNAIARIPQAKIEGLDEDDLRELQDKARDILDRAQKSAAVAKLAPTLADGQVVVAPGAVTLGLDDTGHAGLTATGLDADALLGTLARAAVAMRPDAAQAVCKTAPSNPAAELPLYDLALVPRPRAEWARRRAVKAEGPPAMLVSEVGPKQATVQGHFRGATMHLDLRLQVGEHAIGWTLLVQKKGAVPEVSSIAEAKDVLSDAKPSGSDAFKSFAAPDKVMAVPKGKHSLDWLKTEDKVIEPGSAGATENMDGVMVVLERLKWEQGVTKEGFHEVFLSDGGAYSGCLSFWHAPNRNGGEPSWIASLSVSGDNLVPFVLTQGAVDGEVMPPEGRSWIPMELEKVTPEKWRYWTMTGNDAINARRALVDSGYFGGGAVKLVNERFARVVSKRFLCSAPDDDYTGTAAVAKQRIAPSAPVEPVSCELSKSDGAWQLEVRKTAGAPLLLRLHDAPVGASVSETARGAMLTERPGRVDLSLQADGALSGRWSVVAIDENAREWSMSRVANVQKATGPEVTPADRDIKATVYNRLRKGRGDAAQWVYECAVGPLPQGTEGQWNNVVEVAGAKYTRIGKTAPVDIQADIGDTLVIRHAELLLDTARGKSVTWFTPEVIGTVNESPHTTHDVRDLVRDDEVKDLDGLPWGTLPLIKSETLRYVLGVVLEPNDGSSDTPMEPDKQHDVYSEKEIRDAAWRFMEKYRRVGEMHERLVDTDKIQVVESYIAPVDFEIGGQRIRKGTWMLGAHVIDTTLWSRIKQGDYNAWSVDGTAMRKPVK